MTLNQFFVHMFLWRELNKSTNSLAVEWNVAIVLTRVRFPVSAFFYCMYF